MLTGKDRVLDSSVSDLNGLGQLGICLLACSTSSKGFAMHVIRSRAQQLLILLLISLGVLSLGGCGGGGGITNPALVQKPQVAPAAGTLSLVLTGGAQSANLPSVAGFTESISLPANNAASGTTLTLTVSNQASGAMPALAADMHVAQPFLYLTLNSNKTVTLNGYPGFTMTLPPSVHPTNLPLKIGFYDPTNGWEHIGNMTLSGSTATFSPTSGSRIALNANVNYYAITYACQSSTVPLAGPGKPQKLPSLAGFDGQFIVPPNNAPEGTMVTLTSFDTKPTKAPSPQAVNRRSASVATLSGGTVLFWVSTDYSSSFTFAAFPVMSFDLPEGTNTSGVTFHLETFDGSTLLDQETASSVSGLTVNFPGTASPFVITTGHTYWWELISVPSTRLYVANLSRPTFITVYDQNGNQITPSGTFPNLRGASRIAFNSSNGQLYVTSFINNAVTVYDQSGNQITPSGTFPNLSSPYGIAFDSSNRYFFVINLGPGVSGPYTITVYDQNGNQITTSGTFPHLNTPFGIAFDSSNQHLYVINVGNNTITEYDQNGNQITPSGTFPHLSSPNGIAFDSSNGHLYVTNQGPGVTGPYTITVYDQNGNQITPSGTFPNLSNPVGIAFDSSSGHLYVTNVGNNTITEYDENGNQIAPSGTFPNLHGPDSLVAVP
jgi:DNA-binding beta-propeller fold protein YncE